MRRLRGLLFAIPAVLLIAVLCYSLVQAARIYIPLRREEKAFEALRASIRALEDVQAEGVAATGGGSSRQADGFAGAETGEQIDGSAGTGTVRQADGFAGAETGGQADAPAGAETVGQSDGSADAETVGQDEGSASAETGEQADGSTAASAEGAQAAVTPGAGEPVEAQPEGRKTPFRYAPLTLLNEDFVGWLTIPDTQIDYPVMKSPEDDPQYYLHRDFYRKYAYSGCLFIGGGCDAQSESFIIYGHNMKNDSMFGTLDQYADYDYALRHRDILFSTPEGDLVYRVFSIFQTKVYANRDDVFKYYEKIGTLGEADYAQTVETLRRMSSPSLPDAPAYPAQLMFLSTCSYHTTDGRFVVAAYRVE